MATVSPQYYDRVYQLTTATGNGNLLLGRTPKGYLSFADAIGTGKDFEYVVEAVDRLGVPSGVFEVGIGQIVKSGDNYYLRRDTVYKNHLGTTAKIAFGTGDKNVWCDVSAKRFNEYQDTLNSAVSETVAAKTAVLTTFGSSSDAASANTVWGKYNATVAMLGKSTDATSANTVYGKYNATVALLGTSSDAASANTVWGKYNATSALLGKSTDASTANTVYGQMKKATEQANAAAASASASANSATSAAASATLAEQYKDAVISSVGTPVAGTGIQFGAMQSDNTYTINVKNEYLKLSGGTMTGGVVFSSGSLSLQKGLYYRTSTNINLDAIATSQKEDWAMSAGYNSDQTINNGGIWQLGAYQFNNTQNYVAGIRVANPRSGNIPAAATNVHSGNEWGMIGVKYWYDTNYAYGWVSNSPTLNSSRADYDANHVATVGNLKIALGDYLPLAGGTMTGAISQTSSSGIICRNDDHIGYWAGTASSGNWSERGASLQLYSKNSATASSGSFILAAYNGTTEKSLTGKPDGTLTWGGNDVYVANKNNVSTVGNAITRSGTTNWLRFTGGETDYTDGGSIGMFGKEHASSAGVVHIRAFDGTNPTSLIINPNSNSSFSRGLSIGGETISASNIHIQNGNLTRGTAPSANQNHYIGYRDKNGNNIGRILFQYNTAKRHGMYMEPCNDSGASNGILGIFMDAAGTTAYTQAPTPAQTDDSTKIATTAYVKDCVPKSVGSSTKLTYTDSNGVLTASNADVGSADVPVYLKAGVLTAADKSFDDYLPLAGGTMTGRINAFHEFAYGIGTNSYLRISGGNGGSNAYDGGASLWLHGKDQSSYEGQFRLRSYNSSTSTGYNLIGTSDGVLTWSGPVVTTSDDSNKLATTAYVKDCVPKSVGNANTPVYVNENGVVTSTGKSFANYVPTSRTINGKALSGNITLSASDIGVTASAAGAVGTDNGSCAVGSYVLGIWHKSGTASETKADGETVAASQLQLFSPKFSGSSASGTISGATIAYATAGTFRNVSGLTVNNIQSIGLWQRIS